MPPKRHRTITVKTRQASLPLKPSVLRAAVEAFLDHEGVLRAELSFVFLPSADIRKLNKKFLGHDFVTDVITFDLRGTGDGGRGTRGVPVLRPASVVPRLTELEAEIYICLSEARRNAREYREPAAREILRYVAHGILHLLGYDDGNAKGQARMREKEEELLQLIDVRHRTPDTGYRR